MGRPRLSPEAKRMSTRITVLQPTLDHLDQARRLATRARVVEDMIERAHIPEAMPVVPREAISIALLPHNHVKLLELAKAYGVNPGEVIDILAALEGQPCL